MESLENVEPYFVQSLVQLGSRLTRKTTRSLTWNIKCTQCGCQEVIDFLRRCFKTAGARKAADSTSISPTSQMFDNERIQIKKHWTPQSPNSQPNLLRYHRISSHCIVRLSPHYNCNDWLGSSSTVTHQSWTSATWIISRLVPQKCEQGKKESELNPNQIRSGRLN